MASDSGGGARGTDVWVSSSVAYQDAEKEAGQRQRVRVQDNGLLRHEDTDGSRLGSVPSTPHGQHPMRAMHTAPNSTVFFPVYIERAARSPDDQQASGPLGFWGKQQRNRRHAQWLFYFITAAHVALLIVSLYLNDWIMVDLSENPLLGPGLDALLKIGLLVSPFLGAGVLHVCANISAICTFGLFLANQLAAWQLAVLYTVSGLSAVTTSANIGSSHVTAAGSGPAFGFVGASCCLLLIHYKRLRNHWLSWLLIICTLAIDCFIGATPFVDNSGNVAGFVAGFLTAGGMLCLRLAPSRRRGEIAVRLASMLMFAVAVMIPVIGIIGINGGVPLGGCCEAWVCAPSPWWSCSASQVELQGCGLLSMPNGTISLSCAASGASYVLPANTTADVLNAVCQAYCYKPGSSSSFQAPSPATGGPVGTPGQNPLTGTS